MRISHEEMPLAITAADINFDYSDEPNIETPAPAIEPPAATPESPDWLKDGFAPWEDKNAHDDGASVADDNLAVLPPQPHDGDWTGIDAQPIPAETKVTTQSFSITAKQQAEILRICNNENVPFENRAGWLLRKFGRVLNFSIAAESVYRNICGYMGASKGCEKDEVIVSAAHMEQWFGRLKKRAIQNAIREITLTGALPLLEKVEPGGLGKRTTYRFVRDPFALAKRQALQAMSAKPGDRNVANRPTVVITGDAPTVSPTPAREPRVAGAEKRTPVDAAAALEGFEQFWNAYPKRESKGDAEKAWREVRAAELGLLPTILDALRRQRQQSMWTRDGGRWVPYPAKWLRGRKWEDDSQDDPRARIDAEIERTLRLLAERSKPIEELEKDPRRQLDGAFTSISQSLAKG